jgi:hypothetical protein
MEIIDKINRLTPEEKEKLGKYVACTYAVTLARMLIENARNLLAQVIGARVIETMCKKECREVCGAVFKDVFKDML